MHHAACKVEFQLFNRSYSQLTFFNFFVKLSINNHTVRSIILYERLIYHAACKVEFQPFKRSYSQLTFLDYDKYTRYTGYTVV